MLSMNSLATIPVRPARFRRTCPACEHLIELGDEIARWGRFWVHSVCAWPADDAPVCLYCGHSTPCNDLCCTLGVSA